MTRRLGELRLVAELESVRMISYFLRGVSERLNLTEKVAFDIEFSVEEAAVNIVTHAYPDTRNGEMLISMEADDEFLIIELTDWGIPLDPRDVKPFDINAPVETRIKGGMGLYFIGSMMDSVQRTTTPLGEPNSLRLLKRIERMEPGSHQHSATRELNAVLSVSQVMSAGSSLDHLLDRVINTLVEIIEAEQCVLYLFDEATNQLRATIQLEDERVQHEISLELSSEFLKDSWAGSVKVINMPNPYADPRFSPAFDEITGFRSRNVLAAPMFNKQKKILGVVYLLNKRGGSFDSRDERLLSAMAAQVAVSIENARLYEQALRQHRVDQELETARSIQFSFLPQHLPMIEGWEISTLWQPMREVGGDFYDIHSLPDGRIAFVLADVSGKGIPAALFMAFCVTVIRFAMSMDFEPADLLARANQVILADQQSRMFMTAFVSYVDMNTGRVQFASGGHNPAIIYRHAPGNLEYLSTRGVALGLFGDASFAQAETTLDHGDVLVMYTDGLTEAINHDEEEFGEDRLGDIVRLNAGRTAHEITELITRAVSEFSDSRGFDDETLVIIKRQ